MICTILIITDLGFFKVSLPSLNLKWSGGSIAGSGGNVRPFQGLPGHESPFTPQTSLGCLAISQVLPNSHLTDSSTHFLGFKSAGSNFPDVSPGVPLSLPWKFYPFLCSIWLSEEYFWRSWKAWLYSSMEQGLLPALGVVSPLNARWLWRLLPC